MKRRYLQFAFLLLLIVGTVFVIRQQQSQPYQKSQGKIFGTYYTIIYQADNDLSRQITKVLNDVDASLSTFNKESIISKMNRNEAVTANDMFTDVFELGQQIAKETNGSFDMTVAPLVNAWGFGFKNDIQPTKQAIDSLRQFVGYQKVSLRRRHLVKTDNRLQLDCSAIAKGYGCDCVANFLRREGIKNFLVEIGGEVVTSGINEERLPWHIAVIKPTDDALQESQETQTILNVTDKALATSGNYRNFYYKGGKKYAHTIDPSTGYPVQHSLLSATVLADNCATADAFATAFMVMGMDKAQTVLQQRKDLMAYFIYDDGKGNTAVWFSPSLKDKLPE